jgi:hypothetical protein
MNSIRDEALVLDTNVFVFALRKDARYPACEILLFDRLYELRVYVPLQIFVELQRNLTPLRCVGFLVRLSGLKPSRGIMRRPRLSA